MASPSRGRSREPSYLLHKPSGCAITVLRAPDGRRQQIYLGDYGSPASRRRYHEILAEFHAHGEQAALAVLQPEDATLSADAAPSGLIEDLLISELVARFLLHAEAYYRTADGEVTGEYGNFVCAAEPLLDLYRDELANDFGPLKLKRVQQEMIRRKLSRTTINGRVQCIKHMFKWGIANEVVAPVRYEAVRTVPGLRYGRSEAPEPVEVQPVAWSLVEATLPHLPPPVAAMVKLQWWSGMRPGEVLIMRSRDIDRSGSVWLYRPSRHKTQHVGRQRVVALGPQCQEILRSYLRLNPKAFLFVPEEGELSRRKRLSNKRQTPLTPSQLERARLAAENPRREFNDRYTTRNYRQAILRACRKLDIEEWSPNQLRHAAATRIRKEAGLEAARAVLGHSVVTVTQHYAEIDQEAAVQAMGRLG